MTDEFPKVGDILQKLECIFCGRTYNCVILSISSYSQSYIYKTDSPDPEWELEELPSDASVGATTRAVCDTCRASGHTLAQKDIPSSYLRIEVEKLGAILYD